MAFDRREAIALASGLVAASTLSSRADACAITTLPYSPSLTDRDRISHKFEALRYHWHHNSLDEFFRQHCTSAITVDFNLDGRGGRWANTSAINLLRERYPRIIGDSNGIMFDPYQAVAYSMVAFEAGPTVPPHHPSDLRCGRSDFPPAFVIAMAFKTDRGLSETTLSGEQDIVTGLTFRASMDFDQRFYQPR